jgi:hypothetical protein
LKTQLGTKKRTKILAEMELSCLSCIPRIVRCVKETRAFGLRTLDDRNRTPA